jgi:hypothetical protein
MAKNLTSIVKSISSPGVLPYKDQHIWDFVPSAIGQCACNHFADRPAFCVPEGITKATFHIWGAGGHGQGLCNCGFSVPSGSGAYAYKTISVTPGDCYRVKVGVRRCCFAYQADWQNGDCRDSDHGTTYITGTGLTNFCAEGGYHGTFVCCTTTDYASSLLDSATPYYSAGDSAGGPNRACFYGADGGARGIKSYVTTNHLGISNHCNIRFWYALPACSPFAKFGGHIQTAACCNQQNPIGNERNMIMNSEHGYCGNPSTDGAAGKWNHAGMGTGGGTSCTTTCWCGSVNFNGKVRIFYS